MKKTIYWLGVAAICIAFASCGSKETAKNKEEYVANQADTEKTQPMDAIAMGEEAVKQSDCKTCHHKTNKIIGPSHTDVAKKYEFTEANVKLLAEKIVKGGSGTWGQIPMSPHPDISQADAEKMARYVLSLDGEKEH